MAHPKIIDLFAGPGGWDTGLGFIGRTDVLGIEWDTAACETARAAGHEREQADIAELAPSDFGPIEGLIASPPCQGFSLAGKGHGREDSALIIAAVSDFASGVDPRDTLRSKVKDDRSVLALEPLRWALALEPEWTTWEQVPAVLPLWEACAVALRSAGYSVWTGLVQAEQYGVPQTRKRAILTATREGVAQAPSPTHSRYYPHAPAKLDSGIEKWVSMAEALGWGDRFTHMGDVRNAHGCVRPVTAPAPTLTASMDNGNFQWVQLSNYSGHELDENGKRLRGTRSVELPSSCITSKGFAWVPESRATVKSPNERIRVTVQEAGILQSFPADYPWQGTKTAQYRQVGDAVPPLLAAHILASVGAGALAVEEVA